MAQKPILSIGIIFKNDIRCIERCLKSLQPLRNAVPCELVMADTGSTDGSRAVVEKYADILFDFPWIDDFSAARNAVMDRCSGEWYFSIDTDQWLDRDIRELKAFLSNRKIRTSVDACGMMERNYFSYDTGGSYGSFVTCRMLRMATGVRFQGRIHENWALKEKRGHLLRKTLLHHDGYVEAHRGTAEGRKKMKRNMDLLRKKLDDNPEDLLTHLQLIGSGNYEPDFDQLVRSAVAAMEAYVEEGKPFAHGLAGALYSRASIIAIAKKLPEADQWLQRADELFSDVCFVQIDTAFYAAKFYLERNEYERAVHWGEMYLRGYKDFLAGRIDANDQGFNSLQQANPQDAAALKIRLSRAYFLTGREDNAAKLLRGLDCTVLDGLWTGNLLKTLQLFHTKGEKDVLPLVSKLWEEIQVPAPDEKWAEDRRESFRRTGIRCFGTNYIKNEAKAVKGRRPVYTLYTPLRGKCALGTAAALLESDSPAEMEALLGSVEKWDDLPITALSHALRAGVQFPPSGVTMTLVEMDALAAQLAKQPEELREILALAMDEDFTGSWRTLAWVRGLALAAVQTCDWRDTDTGLWLARLFAKTERAFITGCYTPEVLREGNLFVLPPMHHFGWYCAQAFDALEVGDTVGYVRFLREGLAACGNMKAMVEFLTKHTPELQAPPPSPELLDMAEKVRNMLAAYSPDDPAVAALKASPVYQKVAYLIE